MWKPTVGTEASVHALILTLLAPLRIAAGVRTSSAAFFVLHVEGALLSFPPHTHTQTDKLETAKPTETNKKYEGSARGFYHTAVRSSTTGGSRLRGRIGGNTG